MSDIINFFIDHWLLSSAFVVILLLLAANEWRGRIQEVGKLSAQQVINMINHENGVVLDIRQKEQFVQGHILGAINLPASEVEKRINVLNKYKSKPIIVAGETSNQHLKICKLLEEKGFNVHQLVGGMSMWRTDEMPTTTK